MESKRKENKRIAWKRRRRKRMSRQAKLLESLRSHRNAAEHQGLRASCHVCVDAETAYPGQGKREIRLVSVTEGRDQVLGKDLGDHVASVLRRQRRHLKLAQASVDPHARRGPHLAVQVRSARRQKI